MLDMILFPFRLVLYGTLWAFYLPMAILASRLVLIPIFLAIPVIASMPNSEGLIGTDVFLIFGHFAMRSMQRKGKINRPSPWPSRRPRRQKAPRRARPAPVPGAQGLSKNAPAPTVSQTLARLSPRLRAVIAQPRLPT